MSKIYIFVTSKAMWSLVGLFVLHGLTAIVPSLHGTIANIAQGILLLLTFYLHPAEVQTAGVTGRLANGQALR